MRCKIMTFGAALLLSACASVAHEDAPAVLVDPTAESQAELARVVSSALGTSEVTISSSALTHDSALAIERTPLRDTTGQRVTGRDFEKPEHFKLVKSGTRCVLVHVSTAKRYELEHARCAAMSAP
jgi:hypothetical protein